MTFPLSKTLRISGRTQAPSLTLTLCRITFSLNVFRDCLVLQTLLDVFISPHTLYRQLYVTLPLDLYFSTWVRHSSLLRSVEFHPHVLCSFHCLSVIFLTFIFPTVSVALLWLCIRACEPPHPAAVSAVGTLAGPVSEFTGLCLWPVGQKPVCLQQQLLTAVPGRR